MSAKSRQCPNADCERFDEPQHSIICYGCGTPTYVVDAWGDRTVDASTLGAPTSRGGTAAATNVNGEPGLSTLALLSLIFGCLGIGLGAVILGHVARRNIRTTGERGDGLAVAGLVLGYITVLIGAAVVVVYIVAIAQVFRS
jgi:vacuolar-type H+-ATPase subunit I/STV1